MSAASHPARAGVLPYGSASQPGKEDIFFGANDFYYDLKYEFSADSEDVLGHGLRGEIYWDIDKKLNFKTSLIEL